MFREGYDVKVLDSVTLEEANSDFVNWVKQRSRWYKGYLQTFLIHLRSPREVTREIHWQGVGHLSAFVGGTPILAVVNPIFWGEAEARHSRRAHLEHSGRRLQRRFVHEGGTVSGQGGVAATSK